MGSIQYLEQVPGPEEFIELRRVAGLTVNSIEAATKGLAGTCFAVCVRDAGKLIGMGRIIGDGGCFYQVVDIAVHPEHQRRGIGYQIMTRLMKQLREHAPKTAYVSLIADGDASKLYQKFGFKLTAPVSAGMALRL